MATADSQPQGVATTTVTSSLTRGEKAKSALIGVRKFLEEKLTADRPAASSSPSPPHDERMAGPVSGASGDPAVLAFFKSTGQFRQAHYGAEFLETFANRYMTMRRDRGERRKVNVIAGPRAEQVYRKFMRQAHDEEKRPGGSTAASVKPVVFAFASHDKDKKGVKFYKSWRNSKDTSRNRGVTHNGLGHRLDDEFDKVLGYLDSEFNRMSLASVVSLPFLQSVPFDGNLSGTEEEDLKRPLRPTNPDSMTSINEESLSNDPMEKPLPPIDHLQEGNSPSVDADPSLDTAPDIIVSSAELASSPESSDNDIARFDRPLTTAEASATPSPPHETDQVAEKESLSVPRAPSRNRRKSRQRSKGAHPDGESYLTDASSDAGNSSLSGASDHSDGQSGRAQTDVSEFTIVLLEDGKEYSLARRDRNNSPSSPNKKDTSASSPRKKDDPDDAAPWWATSGQQPPPHPHTPRLVNASDKAPMDVSPWWSPHFETSNKKKSRTPDKSEYRSRPHPEVGSTTWKKYMEPVMHAPAAGYDHHDVRLIEYIAPHPSEHLSPIRYYPRAASPVLYGIPYGSPVASWGSYIDASPMGWFSGQSEHVSLPIEEMHPPIFTDARFSYMLG